MMFARDLMKHPNLVSEFRTTIPQDAELNQLGQDHIRRITENVFPGKWIFQRKA